jgi:plastocyanin
MRRTLIALALATAVFAGCGGDDDDETAATPAPTESATQEPASGGAGAIDFSAPADGSLKFDQTDVTAKAGKATVNFDNPSSVPHAVEIEGNGVEKKTETVTGGKAPAITVDLKPGTYTFYCPVDGHEAAGMKGTLTVK